MEFLDGLDTLLKTYWYIALPTSLIFAIQTVMTFIGVDASDGLDADFDGDLDGAEGPFQLFSLRNLINFLLGFSWSGISLWDSFENKNILIAVSVVIGFAFLMIFFLIIKQVMKLAENNSFKLSSTVGKTAEVYLRIPGEKSGMGKVSISVKGSYKTLNAITEGGEISTGAVVNIVSIQGNSILIVKNIKE
ncbi:MAG: hypothetical protein ACJA0Q_001521 [Saprospiraceae bacterium]|jgi:membrane protein implicated in regulation of membrane protease activity